jgi:hypothetical protein
MARQALLGASMAATLPAALAAAVFVSAPFAGTTTAPLSDQHKAKTHHHKHCPPERRPGCALHKAKRGALSP